ncbi:anti-sigma factor antagonist [Bacteroidetes/Chlorobi group bacterium ChocPot_Mid]|jgi:anti-sigma B factor antagonist|nr:MAG: anti-sigma factor antagonist [Bacteroidetes/Chlorobi group bacterium ChocPot_Mid]
MNTELIVKELNKQTFSIMLGENLFGGNEALTFSSKINELCNNNAKNIIVDLNQVKMINSSGIGMLVGGLTTSKKNNASLILVGLSDKIKSLLQMTHLDQVFATFDSIDDALKSI